MRSYTRDRSITSQRLKPGSVRRIASYARPYRGLAGAVPDRHRPGRGGHGGGAAAAEGHHRRRHPEEGHRPGIGLAGLAAGIALLDALLSLAERWLSSRIGEGLIYDLRSQVFAHVQRQPIAFFTRAQTGSLVSRLNSDVIGAQQALTSTLSAVVSNSVSLVLVAGGHVPAVVAGHAHLAGPGAAVHHPGPAAGPPPAAADPRVHAAGRPDGLHHDRALQRGRRDAGQAVRPPRRGGRGVRAAGPRGSATSACMHGGVRQRAVRRAQPAGLAGHRRRLRGRRQPGHQRLHPAGHAGRADPAAEPGCTGRSPRCPTSRSTS